MNIVTKFTIFLHILKGNKIINVYIKLDDNEYKFFCIHEINNSLIKQKFL